MIAYQYELFGHLPVEFDHAIVQKVCPHAAISGNDGRQRPDGDGTQSVDLEVVIHRAHAEDKFVHVIRLPIGFVDMARIWNIPSRKIAIIFLREPGNIVDAGEVRW